MTTTQTPCTPDADRVPRAVTAPDPPARKRYWEDTVFEAVGELRARLASSREEVVTMAVETIIAVEKTRMRHGRPLSGTQASHARDDDGSLPKLGPLEVDQPSPPKRREGEAPAEPPPAHGEQIIPISQVSNQPHPVLVEYRGRKRPKTFADQPAADELPATVRPTRERGPPAVADIPAVVVAPDTAVARPGGSG